MKHVVLMIGILFSAIQLSAQESESQEFYKTVFGIKGGVNVSQFSASINSETRPKAGPAFGVYLKDQIGSKLFFRLELFYSNQGEKIIT